MLTVLMATCNGAQTLPKVLDGYCRLQTPRQAWQLIIVENGSSDGTGALIAQYQNRLPLHLISTPDKGKNAALNLAVEWALRHSDDDALFIFSDDDATPAPDWLLQWERCVAAHADYAVFGGAIEADWAVPPPEWLPRLTPVGLTFGLTAADLAEGPVFPGLVWGANMAVRREVFDAGYRYDTSIGPNGGAYAMGSETELTRRLALAGYPAWFCRHAKVAHHIRKHQLTRAYVLDKAWRFGRGKYRQDRPGTFPEWSGVPRWMLARFAQECIGYLRERLLGDADALFRRRWELAFLRGYFFEARQGRSEAGKRVLITSYSGELGGMEMRMAQELRYLRLAGADGSLALRRFAGIDAWAGRLAHEQIVVAEFDPPPFFEQWAWRRWNLLRARLGAARRLRAFRADLVHIAWCWTNYGASALWLARYCRLPAVISVHNAFPAAEISDWHQPLLQHAFGGVRGVYAVSRSAMAHFMAIYQPYLPATARVAVIPNCVDTDRFKPGADMRHAARLALQLPPGALVIGVAARLSEQKRPGHLLDLFVLLRQRFPQLYLVMMGSGPLEAGLRRQVEQAGLAPYVVFTGFVPALETLLPALDLHILMSRNEGFGIATIEAMACGVPAVATDVPGSADILRDCGGGLLVPANDIKAAAAMVAELLDQPGRREAMGQQARQEAVERYSRVVVGKQVLAFYDQLI
ncbi:MULTISPECIES: glycosyltransferase [unclassified Duganella]|uniref:glycosyltransferase n=1 Tax=unclassified Duganella TaxID=2636909 RepID=UPI001E431150|nr:MULTISPECIES: glycosyltransferase [unclassified Duganella]